MCGVAALVGGDPAEGAAIVSRMVERLRHRGPDQHGVVDRAGCVLGSSRLVLVDEAGGRQPMAADGLVVAFNGEVYDHDEVRRRLDYPFRTRSDTEVLLALYRRHGSDLAASLHGMFAFCLWDERAHRLTCARDRFGERPLYYATTDDGGLVVASEVKGILASGLVEPVVDQLVLADYLSQGFVPPDRCIYRTIEVLPPAHQLTFEDGVVEVTRYWAPPPVAERWSPAAAAAALAEVLPAAVERQLAADVPVGTMLSGGVDSSTVAALAGRARPGLPAFCFDFAGPESELPFAQETARRHHLDLHVLSERSLDVASLLAELPDVYDEPFGDSSAVPTLAISRFAAAEVTAVLTGDGADELLGGYFHWSRTHLAGVLEPDGSPITGPGPVRGRLRRILGRPAPPPPPGHLVAERYATFRRQLSTSDLEALGLPPAPEADRWRAYAGDDADVTFRYDLDGYLPGDILVKTDRAAMACSLEVRSPFLDVEVAELLISLPVPHKIDGTAEKLVLRRAFADLWPAAVRERPKQGFGAPLAAWLRRDDVHELRADLVDDPRSSVYDLVDQEGARAWAGGDDQRAWNLLCLAIWSEARLTATR